MTDERKVDENAEQCERAHEIICALREIVARVLSGAENDEDEMDEALGKADEWVRSWRAQPSSNLRAQYPAIFELRDEISLCIIEAVLSIDHCGRGAMDVTLSYREVPNRVAIMLQTFWHVAFEEHIRRSK